MAGEGPGVHSESGVKRWLRGLLFWLRDVALLVLAIMLVMFGAILLYALYFAVRFHDPAPFGRMVEIVVFVACLRFLITPSES